MIPSIPQSRLLRVAYAGYVTLFFVYLAAPLSMVALFAFNDSMFPSLPWEGFTLDWFIGSTGERIGLFFDDAIGESIWISIIVAFWVSLGSVVVGTCNAFLFERYEFRFKGFLYMLMLTPLVIPESYWASRCWWRPTALPTTCMTRSTLISTFCGRVCRW